MNKTTFMKVALSFIGATLFVSCTDFYMDIPASEQYTRSFIKEFGVPDPEHDWNMATEGTVTVNVGDKPADVKIYAKYGEKYYLVADLPNVSGKLDVPFDMPKGCEEVLVIANGETYYGNIGGMVDCSNHPEINAAASRSSEDSNGAYKYNPDDIRFEKTAAGAKVTVSTPTEQPAYIYFNAQQMAPILQRQTPWHDYYSMTDGTLKENTDNAVGILPESSGKTGDAARNISYQQGNAYLHSQITQDFVYQLHDPQKGFDIYPMFYGSNLQHTLGIYLIDDQTGEPIRDSNNKIIKYPIYQSKHGDDIQIKDPIKDFNVYVQGGQSENGTVKPLVKNRVVGAYEITMTTDAPSYKVKFNFGNYQLKGNYTVKIGNDAAGNFSYLDPLSFSYGDNATTYNGGDVSNEDTFWIYASDTTSNKWVHFIIEADGYHADVCLLITATASSFPTHTYTHTFNEWPSSLTPGWSSYFVSSGPGLDDSTKANQFSKPRRAAGDVSTITSSTINVREWSGTQLNYDWSQLEVGDIIRLTGMKKSDDWTAVNWDTSGDFYQVSLQYIKSDYSWANLDDAASWTKDTGDKDLVLTSDMISKIQTKNSLIVNGWYGTITGVYHVKGGTQTPEPDPEPGNWKAEPNGKTAATTALVNYYKGLNHDFICNADGYDSDGYVLNPNTDTEVKVSVTILDDAALNNIKYKVILSKTVYDTSSPAPVKRGGRMPKNYIGGGANSRAGETYEQLTASGGALYHNNETKWHDIRMAYNEVTGKVDSYDYDVPLLVKSRGYHVDVYDIVKSKDWNGYFGMYIDFDWGEYESPDGSVNDFWTPGAWGRPKSGTHYSQSSLNVLEYGAEGSKQQFPISYAATFTHPMSSNQYLCFEDWDVTKPVGDLDIYGNAYEGSLAYTGFDWANHSGDYSSDRDLNDIIYRQVGLVPRRTTEIKKTESRGFTWIWALEDLGNTDDFDFNDVVMRISSITTTASTTTSDSGTGVSSTEQTSLVKKITFTPRCAGGTLPIYVHFTYVTGGQDVDCVLRPGNFNLTTEAGRNDLRTGEEFHKWFGVDDYKKMINTGASSNGITVPESQIQKCTLEVDANYKLNNIPVVGISNPQTNVVDGYTADGVNATFYVTVNSADSKNKLNHEIYDERTKDAYAVGMAAYRGAAPQSFIIIETVDDRTYTVDDDGNLTPTGGSVTPYATKWRWPKERTHILDAYPKFKEWIKNKDNHDWFNTAESQYLY